MKRSAFAAVATCLCFASPMLAHEKTQPKAPGLPAGTVVEKNIAYGPHERNKLDIYVPAGDGPFPLLVWVHGGAWRAGSKDGNVFGLPMLAKGYAVASINYRYTNHAIYPAQIHDCKGAIRFLRASAKKYKLDEKHFGVSGGSAGGHLVALLGTTGGVDELEGDVGGNSKFSSRVQAVCDIFGPTDIHRMGDSAGFPKETHPIRQLLGGTVDEKKELCDQASPVKFVTKDDAPFIILHGTKDPLVPVEQSQLMHDELKKGGVESTLIVIEGAGHDGKVFTPDSLKRVEAFFDKHLKGK
jgi:acetyl esterase/lipase